MTKSNFTSEQLKNLHKRYILKNISIQNLADEYNVSYRSIWQGFKKLGLEILPQSITRRKFPIQESYFSDIDTEEKAYWLGFLYADACNTPSKNRLEISLAKQDVDILEKLSRTLLFGNLNIKEYKSQKKNVQDKVALYIINKSISHDLAKWGCFNRKTFTLKFPKIPTQLHSHFLRGYFDGDGMLVIYSRLQTNCKNKTNTAEFSILSTKEMLDVISNIFSQLGVRCKINKRHKGKDNNNFTLRVHGNQQIKKICDYLYKDATLFLNRKHEVYLQLLELSKKFRKEYKYV